jgi:hypothetical protein
VLGRDVQCAVHEAGRWELAREVGLAVVDSTFKAKSESDLGIANPAIMTSQTVDQLKTMTIQINVSDDVFYNTAAWEQKSNGWLLRDKYMFL